VGSPVNENFEELLIWSTPQAGVGARITAVIPDFGYAAPGQEDEAAPRHGEAVATDRARRHAPRGSRSTCTPRRSRGFFDIPVDHLYASR